jgi:hypothetical protein
MPPDASAIIDLSVSVSAEQVTQQLSDMQAAYSPSAPTAPTTAHDADLRLTQLINDPDWARKLMAGDIATRDEFQRLTELKAFGDVIGDAISGEMQIDTTIGDSGLTRRDLIGVAQDMLAEGTFNADGVALILNDGKFPTEDVRAAQYWLGRMERNPELLYPDLGDDRDQQMKFLRTIVAIGDGSGP